MIVAAGNPPEYNKSVREFDVVTLDRVKKIQAEPDYQAWRKYAFQENFHPAILSYLELRNSCFYQMETTIDGKQFATSRGWEDLSRMMEVCEKIGKEINRDLVIQYIQHDRIADEFADYYELYRKYQQDYHIADILKGKNSEAMVKKVSHAPFDEKLSVVNLIFSGMRQKIREAVQGELVLEKVFAVLKGLREDQTEEPLLLRLGDYTDELLNIMEKKKEQGLLERKEELSVRKAAGLLRAYEKLLKRETQIPEEGKFDVVRAAFEKDRAVWEQDCETAEHTMEYAFDFMEAAFYNSQEMVMFVSGINTDFYCVRFLETYECERYVRYNKELLFEDRDRELRRRIQEL